MIEITDLPAVNATLNAASTVLLLLGYGFIRMRRVSSHRACMLGAFVVSAAFLVSYVVYHYHAGSRPFTGEGWIRSVYFSILITHVILAMTILPLAVLTLAQALRGHFSRHRRIARWTLPIWLYVSVTGVIVYWMLYQM